MATVRKVVIAGGSGYLGRFLAGHFRELGSEVVVLSRESRNSHDGTRFVSWDGRTLGEWAHEIHGADVVINLAGRTVNCRYNATNKQQIYDSRLDSTRVVGEAIAASTHPPRVWIQSSSATIYRHELERDMDETTGVVGSGFSVDVCQKWEAVLDAVPTPHTRKVALRLAMVFGPGKDGVFEAFARIARLGLGGTLGRGDQYVSWIHIDDFLGAIQWILDHDDLQGPVNCSAPHPLPNRDLMRTLREELHRPIGLPATAWMLEIGSFLLQTETELLLKSRRVVPAKLLESGYTFRFPHVREAIRDIVSSG